MRDQKWILLINGLAHRMKIIIVITEEKCFATKIIIMEKDTKLYNLIEMHR